MSKFLVEGLRAGDLEDVVLPLLSIDEYSSLLDDSALVLAFYVENKDAADDLNRFIQKSPVEMLDTSVSPAPDQQGYYQVFIDFMNDEKIVDHITGMLAEVSALVNNENWQMRLRGIEGVVDFNTEVLGERLEKLREFNATVSDVSNGIMEFMKESDLHNVVIEGTEIQMASGGIHLIGSIMGYGEIEHLYHSHRLDEAAISLSMTDAVFSRRVSATLGSGWNVTRMGDAHLVTRNGAEKALLLGELGFA